MKSIILLAICIFSCQAAPFNGSEPVLINNQSEQIPEGTTESTKHSETKGQNDLIFPGPPLTSIDPPSPTTVGPSTTPSPTTKPSPTPITKPTPTTKPSPTPITKPTPTTITTPTPTPITKPTPGPTINPTSSTTKEPITTPTKEPTPRPSTQPNVPTTPAVPTNRGFDGPSFIGGIVLSAGLMAIGFVAFKFYKARTELNYHTL